MEQNNEIASSQILDNPGQPSSEPIEKMIPQSQVDRIVKTAKMDVARKAREEALEEMRQPQPSSPSPVAHSNGGLTADQVRAIMAEENQRQMQTMQEAQMMNEAQRIAHEFNTKIAAGKTLYPDYEETVNSLPFASIAHVVGLANEAENTAEIMYELGKNPSKMVTLNSMAQLHPDLARREMRKIAESIKLNQQAKNVQLPNAPLSQIKSSPVSVDDGISKSVSDFRKIFRAR